MLPPRRVRRVTGPLLVAALVATVVLLPALVVVAVVVFEVDRFTAGGGISRCSS